MNLLKILPLAAAITALMAPAAHAASPGINIAGAPTPDRVSEAIATGAKTVRIFALWKDFEPDARGQYPSHDVNLANTIKVYDDAIHQLNAAGAKPLFVVTEAPAWASGSTDVDVPPANPADFADFLKRFAAHNRTVGAVAGYEVWNEPDENIFWHPAPDATQYAAMLRAAYAGIKAGDPAATVVAGPMTGNDYQWLENLYTAGAQGSFDVVAVHTDTACLDRGPDAFYRENDGKLARFTFLGYRTVHDTMVAHGDGGKPIWMSELGWSSTGGVPNSCTRGQWAGLKPSGVTEAQQAGYLAKAYGCLANDPYVTQALWFTMRDTSTEPVDELNHYGLLRTDGSAKPALGTFRDIVAGDGGPPGSCGDFDPPSIRVVKPVPGQQFVDKLDLSAAATDTGVGLARITFSYDGGTEIRNFTDGLTGNVPVGLAPWQGSGKLGLGNHTIEVTALDANGNTSTQTIPVVKVRTLAATLTPLFKLKTKKVTCRKRVCRVAGSLSRSAAAAAGPTPSIGGKVAVEWQYRNKKGKWRKLIGGLKPAAKPFSFSARLKLAGAWRVRLVYRGQAPWRKTTSRYLTFRVK
ncbi:cellulase family glycosylhydrolase [Baekduia soli]|uniref:Cellulase family glycosylhydrolase n=1 Tax=Baekduia soli TaxID=496014 RepID=A0A5B8U226_9ACTN|nr:cellulase family glycosylhydrolase [Baekduia soli]QEC47109.1 cellulase family glycosylhydrolase [Baekduia soli]